jgi:methionyl-tRNA synthetase
LKEQGNTFEDEVDQLLCEKCKRFLADRYVEGQCPKCKSERARGDQCDDCQALLNPIELINPRCYLCSSTPIPKISRHIFIDLAKIKPDL